MKLALIDDKVDDLYEMARVIRTTYPDWDIRSFLYPQDLTLEAAIKHLSLFDVTLINFQLGGTNGANLARNIFKVGSGCRMIVFDDFYMDEFNTFSYYFTRNEIISNPRIIEDLPQNSMESDIDAAVELSVLETSAL